MLTVLLSFVTIVSMTGCMTAGPVEHLDDDREIIIRFENLTDHSLYFEFTQTWNVDNFTVDPKSEWNYSILKKTGEQYVFRLLVSSFIVYIDGIQLPEINYDNSWSIKEYVPIYNNFSVTNIKATKNSIDKSIYTFTITEEVIEAWRSVENICSIP